MFKMQIFNAKIDILVHKISFVYKQDDNQDVFCCTKVIKGHWNIPESLFFGISTCSLLNGFPGWGFAIGTEIQIHSWRLFIFVCLFPALAALVGVIFMPESPRFLLEVRSSVSRFFKNIGFSLLLIGGWLRITTENTEIYAPYPYIHYVSVQY